MESVAIRRSRSHARQTDATGLNVTEMSPAIGAEIGNVDLSRELPDSVIGELRRLLLKHKLLVFRNQDVTPAQHVKFAKRFGKLEVHPVFQHHPDFEELVLLGGNQAQPGRENIYHTDVSWRETPSMGSILRCVECPDAGGDTIWCNMVLAYEHLPEHIKEHLHELHAVHDLLPGFIDRVPEEKREEVRKQYPPVTHPVVRTHPETGEKILYVNAFTTHFSDYIASSYYRGMPELWSGQHALLSYLIDQAKHPEYQVRLKWQKDTIAFWDNRATQHYAVQDYFPKVRRMMRATVIGDKPV